jgi:hypothetical protein
LEPATHGEFDLVLRGGQRIHVSRTLRPLLEAPLRPFFC